MPWYKTGTVSVTLNSNAVTGTGTAFIVNCRVGDAFRGPDGRWYEVTNVASNTAMSIDPAYQGTTAAAGAYALAPMQGYVKDSADALRAIVNTYGAKLAALGTTGNYDILPVTKGGTGGATQADAQTALGLVKTANAYDTTAGRMLKVADFGLGSTGSSYDGATSMDTFFTANQMFTSSIATPPGHNQPLLGTYPMGMHLRRSSIVESQLVLGWGAQGALGFRLKTDISTWAPWRKVYDTVNLVGPVSQSGGIPTGAVIERNSNGNGEYVKYADGTMICWQYNRAISAVAISTAFFGGFRSADINISFPTQFSEAPVVQATTATCFGVLPYSATGSIFTSNFLSVSSQASADRNIKWIAIGRWF
ncbi:hypothetical protein [Pseudomonas sp. NFACC04-2]|uniref:hypothetical protein n=1 Tax=Pseudomonas sp. NFACC04-2 TaxID=1566242 RepID=UPI000908968A|nr:hypothetical protein [Pseudomonas sp. NFACC04-2]SFW77292.1 hypothetical protein SAMN03159439_04627 [Pseudomonas sp. NFACC04-2]